MPDTASFDWDKWGLPLVAGAGFAGSMFGGGGGSNDGLSKAISQLETETRKTGIKGDALDESGEATLEPALKWLKGLTSGNQQDVMQATMPDRRRVIDQYDTAKKAIAEFSPRGGGTAGALAQVNASEASDLATTTAGARQAGIKTAVDLGTALKQMGLSADSLDSQNMANLISAYSAKAQQDSARAGGLGSALGSILGALLI